MFVLMSVVGKSGGVGVSQSLTCDDVVNCYKATKNCFKTVQSGIKCVKSLRTVAVPVIGPINAAWKCYKFYKTITK